MTEKQLRSSSPQEKRLSSLPVEKTIALLGQPNSGKSTLFNALTGSKQHVGNWPGKTVEQKSGTFTRKGRPYSVVDLPGSYSLYACSEEEMITRDYIASGKADLVCIMVDASQLERSLYMLADYVGINCPAILVLNMIDVAAERGTTINSEAISQQLGIPVVAMSAADKNDYDGFFAALEEAPNIIDSSALGKAYEATLGEAYRNISNLLPQPGIGVYSGTWLIPKMIEQDGPAADMIKQAVSPSAWEEIKALLETVRAGALETGKCKFNWIGSLIRGNVTSISPDRDRPRRGWFDRLSTSSRWGKPLAFFMMIVGLIASFLITIPWMVLSFKTPRAILPFILDGLTSAGLTPWLLSLIDVAIKAVGTAVGMAGFVAGSCLVFGFMEEIGYMARISYVFDNTMSRLGLQGKAVMPFLMSFGCTVGGMTSTRVIDSWGQRVLTMALAWMVPCAATWGVVALFGTAFFGLGTVWVIAALFACAFFLVSVTARLFGPRLIKEGERTGLIMELPPYHKPKWGSLFRFVFGRMGNMLRRALVFIVGLSILFWVFAYTADGDIENSVLYRIGRSVEPVTMWFGLRWQTFTALICSVMAKEAALGALSSVFGASSTVVGRAAVSADLGSQLQATLSKAEALAFLFAFFFNIPCIVAVLSTKQESHSWTWTLRIAGYYFTVSLLMSMFAYHMGRLIF
jgi:ferrous iron transport protein B